MLSFQKLRVYQRSIEFLALVLEISALPKGHAELADQLLRASQSQPRNIAEGAGRRTAVDQACAWISDGGRRRARYDARLISETSYTRGIEFSKASLRCSRK